MAVHRDAESAGGGVRNLERAYPRLAEIKPLQGCDIENTGVVVGISPIVDVDGIGTGTAINRHEGAQAVDRQLRWVGSSEGDLIITRTAEDAGMAKDRADRNHVIARTCINERPASMRALDFERIDALAEVKRQQLQI